MLRVSPLSVLRGASRVAAAGRGLHMAPRVAVGAAHSSSPHSELPSITNEPILEYKPGSPERAALKQTLKEMIGRTEEVPVVVGGKEYFTNKISEQIVPSQRHTVLARVHFATPELLSKAIESANAARLDWETMAFEHRLGVFYKAADLMSSKYRNRILAATMLGQSKTVFQAEIDAAAEAIDFFRFGCKYAEALYREQPRHHSKYVWNRVIYRALEGFVAAISPFNFTAIGANLAGTPALMGNVVLWKPSHTAVLSNYAVFQVLREAGLPDGVINFVPSESKHFGHAMSTSPHLAAINFTGSTATFASIWQTVGQNMNIYRTFPRMLGETGGKNFHLVHPSADLVNVVTSTIRSAFEYQGQKCSACSRAYFPKSKWPQIKQLLLENVAKIKIGHVEDFSNFMGAVIDQKSFNKIRSYIDSAKTRASCEFLAGGTYDDREGFFVQPTIIECRDPKDVLMQEEIFGPVLAVHVYDDSVPNAWANVLELVDTTTPYALTGAVFSRDRAVIAEAMYRLRHAQGNLYINDKSTGAVVGQQPFGGARLSGTNDKAGGPQYLTRFTSPMSVKETTVGTTDWRYPHMSEA